MKSSKSRYNLQSLKYPIVVEPCLISMALRLLVALIIAAWVFWISYDKSWFSFSFDLEVGGLKATLIFPVFLLVLLVLCVRPLFMLKDSRLEITNNHLRALTGRLSLRSEEANLPFEDLKGVRVEQFLWQKIIDTGTLIIWTALSEQPDVVIKFVHHPHDIAEIITHKIDESRLESKPHIQQM